MLHDWGLAASPTRLPAKRFLDGQCRGPRAWQRFRRQARDGRDFAKSPAVQRWRRPISAFLPLFSDMVNLIRAAARVSATDSRPSTSHPGVSCLRWTKDGFAKSSTSTWTRSMRRSSNATIRPSRASRWRSAIRPNAASLLRRAMRREVSGFARRCRQPSQFGSAQNSCSCRQGSTSIARCPNRFKRSSRTTPRWSNRSLSMKPIWT